MQGVVLSLSWKSASALGLKLKPHSTTRLLVSYGNLNSPLSLKLVTCGKGVMITCTVYRENEKSQCIKNSQQSGWSRPGGQ